jgi:tetratricopeptide (TPR) repeat protein
VSSQNNLALAYQAAARIAEAITLLERAEAAFKRTLGSEHPKTLASRDNLALAYQAAGRIDKAIELHEQVVTASEDLLGTDHPDTSAARNNLAIAYEAAGRTDEAIRLYAHVTDARERVLSQKSFAERHAARRVQLERLSRLADAEAGAATHVGQATVIRLRSALGGTVSKADVTEALGRAGVRIVDEFPKLPQTPHPKQADLARHVAQLGARLSVAVVFGDAVGRGSRILGGFRLADGRALGETAIAEAGNRVAALPYSDPAKAPSENVLAILLAAARKPGDLDALLLSEMVERLRPLARGGFTQRAIAAYVQELGLVEEEAGLIAAAILAPDTLDAVRLQVEEELAAGRLRSAQRLLADLPTGDPLRERAAAVPEAGIGGGSGGASDGGGGGGAGDDGWVPPARPRYLTGQCPEGVAVGKPFSLVAAIVLDTSPASVELEPFDVPAEGQEVLLVLYAPGLRVLSDQQQTVHVPADGDSRPVRFELRADTPGPVKVSITAWIGGTHLGELRVELAAERDRAPGPHREVRAEISTEPIAGAVSLVVRYDPIQKAYRFEFRDEDNPNEVHSNLAYDPAPLVEQLVADLDGLARGRSGYSAQQTRDYLFNAGVRLWRQLIPGQLREQFWDRQDRMRQLTILADKDAVPWELLYPMDEGHDAGFLVEQFPVTRAIFGWRPTRELRLRPTRFVLPEGSLPEAVTEIEAMRQLLDPGQAPSEVISALTPLTDLIGDGNFGLLHFACHNTYDPIGGSSIKLGNVRFTPTLLEVAVIQKALRRSAPTVFINACCSAGLAATYNRLDGWASKFLEAGAAAFIGSLWAVSDGAAREFAEELYRHLQQGLTLGEAVMEARRAAAGRPDDPTWLAYTVYGDPRAAISRSP